MTHVVIRCDASAEGGIGHLVRAISIAGAAREAGHTVAIAGSIGSTLALNLITESGLEVVDAAADLGVLAAEQGASVVHVDNYEIGSDAHEQVHRSGAILSSVEDGVFGRRRADIVVDSTVRAEIAGRPEDGSDTVLLGIRYAPMRAQVRAAREKRAANNRPLRTPADVLIVMGGTDATGAAATVADVCRRAEGIGRIRVVSPSRNWEAVRSVAGGEVELIEPSPEFLELAADADLVVSAAGTTSWELLCIGVPSVLVAVVENQRAGLNAAVTEDVAVGLGTLEEVRSDPDVAAGRISAAVASLHTGAKWASKGRLMVDGRGAERIVAAWDRALSKRVGTSDEPVRARHATADDSLLLLRWRNDPATRAVSRNSAPVSWNHHSAWFERALADPARELYVVERSGTPLGTVRFDDHGSAEWEVSITLAPEARGRGLAREVLSAGESAFLAEHHPASLLAAILPNNSASQRLFRSAGYSLVPGRRDGEFELLIRRV